MSAVGPIGVFDSGVGGLTVITELVKRLPSEDLIYFGDTARVPYGIRSPRVIQEFSLEIGAWLVSQGVKAIVIACNTASSVALDLLRERLPVPVLGVVEAGARMAAELTRSGRIAIIGTRSTIESRSYPRVLQPLREDLRPLSLACPLLVPLVEEGLLEGPVAETVIRHYLGDLVSQDVDTLVLGCTHYPLLRATIQSVVGESVQVVDAARGVASELAEILAVQNMANGQLQAESRRFVFSDRTAAFQELARRILPDFVGDMEVISVESPSFRGPLEQLNS